MMPYITRPARERVTTTMPRTPGELNYRISTLIDEFLAFEAGGTTYTNINMAIGVLECAKLELYRRIAAPYEDKKMRENGDVYRWSAS